MRFVLIGHPVAHSLSPAIHRAAYEDLGISGHDYVAVDCRDEGAVREQVAAIRSGVVHGANVTVPWKRLALALADEVDPSASSTLAANVLRPKELGAPHSVVAHNTDVPALAGELSGGVRNVRSAAVIGNGGAALAAVAACRMLGATDVTVVARRFRGARGPGWEHAREFETLGARVVAWPEEPAIPGEWRDAVCRSDVIVQSTSDGMSGSSDGTSVANVVPWQAVRHDVFAYDLVYNPAVTRFVAAARAARLAAESGLGMLVGQAALAIELWLGRKPNLEPLRNAALRALAEKNRR